ncbi:DUF6920 family protein [Armatimonas rosea]|uniref:Uncharacterized protein n=1 Tax=Armatimonas rosea TaxID=685828 RepID=A0A7W9W6N9_ARMRO|nr:DUF6544 family protein [Armatimonas rosea]MBB6050793.1 hypothetical protein [Armatimonas rosea]
MKKLSLEELWDTSSDPSLPVGVFKPEQLAPLPLSAQRYLSHAIAPETPLASAVRLKMHGTIKLQSWLSFRAEQVIRWHQGFIWRATVFKYGLPIRGTDSLINGQGAMSWKLLGLVPVMQATGPDTTRSAIGRAQVESVWLPSVLCQPDVIWSQSDELHPNARRTLHDETSTLRLAVDESGRPQSASLLRWGNPDGMAFPYENFGGLFEEEKSFDGYTLPTQVRVGWHFGTPRFKTDGEFFRATIESARFR